MQYNRIILVGRLTRDPEAKTTPSGVSLTTLSIAVDRPQSADARAAGQQKETDFFDVVAWRQVGEYAAHYLLKGRLVLVEGRLQIRQYQGQDGTTKKSPEIVAEMLRAMERNPDQQEQRPQPAPQQRGGYGQRPAPRPAPKATAEDDFGGDYSDPFSGE